MARVVGPAIGAIIIHFWSVAGAFYINAASFLAVIAALLMIRARPVVTKLVPPESAGRMWEFVRGKIREGRQAYVVCPLIEESEVLDAASARQMFADLSLEDFVTATAQTLQDLGNIYAAISYLKHFEGEKHLVFFTEKGAPRPGPDGASFSAAYANVV